MYFRIDIIKFENPLRMKDEFITFTQLAKGDNENYYNVEVINNQLYKFYINHVPLIID